MSELQPLNIVDDRTPEQVRADGDERLPDGSPYILRGVCCVCGKNVAQEAEKYPVHVCLVKLYKVQACGVHLMKTGEWTGPAYWLADGTSICDKCIADMLERLPDNREWLEPALADIRARHLKIGARVRIQAAGQMRGELGTVYNYLPSRPWPWHVRPDIWAEGSPGVAYLADELDVIL